MDEHNNNNDNDNEKYLAAKEKVQEIKSFYYSVVIFFLVNILLVVINYLENPNKLWFYWITIIWGAFLISQALKIFISKGKFFGKKWEERKIKEILKEEEEENSHKM